MPGVVLCESEAEYDILILHNDLAIVNFHADWCGACISHQPKWDKLCEVHQTVALFIEVDVDTMSDLCTNLGIIALPVFFVYKKGKKVDEFGGEDPKILEKIKAKYLSDF